MEIIELIKAKAKAEKVIGSCKTIDQLNAAEKYVELFYNRFESLVDKSELDTLLWNKKEILYFKST